MSKISVNKLNSYAGYCPSMSSALKGAIKAAAEHKCTTVVFGRDGYANWTFGNPELFNFGLYLHHTVYYEVSPQTN